MSSRPRRERKAVQRLAPKEVGTSGAFEVLAGQGQTLGDSEEIVTRVRKEPAKSVVLNKVYRLLFRRAPKQRLMRTHLLQFSGLPDTSDDRLAYVRGKFDELTTPLLKRIMDTFCIDRSSKSFEDGKVTKSALVERLVEWAVAPSLPTKKPAKVRKAKRASKRSGESKDDERSSPKKRKRGSKSKKAGKSTKKQRTGALPDVDLPPGVPETIAAIVNASDVSSITMGDMYTKLGGFFPDGMTKGQKQDIKVVVMHAVQNA